MIREPIDPNELPDELFQRPMKQMTLTDDPRITTPMIGPVRFVVAVPKWSVIKQRARQVDVWECAALTLPTHSWWEARRLGAIALSCAPEFVNIYGPWSDTVIRQREEREEEEKAEKVKAMIAALDGKINGYVSEIQNGMTRQSS